jgi:hypothetical protein
MRRWRMAVAARLNAFYEDGANHRQVYDLQRWASTRRWASISAASGDLVLGYEHVSDERIVDRGVPSRAAGRSKASATPSSAMPRHQPLGPSTPTSSRSPPIMPFPTR